MHRELQIVGNVCALVYVYMRDNFLETENVELKKREENDRKHIKNVRFKQHSESDIVL